MAERFMQFVRHPADALSREMADAGRLRNANHGNANMATIAAEIGYESEAAFSRAFKKMMGVPPSAWRQGIR